MREEEAGPLRRARRRPRWRRRGTCGGRPRARIHNTPTASSARPSRSALSHKPLPARASRPCAPARGSAPTIKATIETFPKGAIYLLPINRSAVIKKSMWQGWASRQRGEKGATALRPRGGRGPARAWERRVPPGPHPRASHLGARAAAGRVPSGGEGRARPPTAFLGPCCLSVWRAGRAVAASGRSAAPRLLLLLRRLNGGFVKWDR